MPDHLPQTAREVHLAARPQGKLTSEEFRLVEVPLAPPEPGRVLVRNEYLGIVAALRPLMDPESEIPLPQFALDRPLRSDTVGRVAATGVPHIRVGDLVLFRGPWADYADTTEATVLDPAALPEPCYHLAIRNGATALLGMRDIAGVTEGDTVLVSGAAGGVGSLAGQIARRLGAARVIGTAGSAAKCRWLVEELGFDEAIDYHDGDLVTRLRAAAPEGISVYFDLVGGAQFEAAVECAADHARFAVCGALATRAGAPWPRLDTGTAVVKDLTVRGFALHHGWHAFTEWTPLFSHWLGEGLVYPHTVVDGGIEAAPRALRDLLDGRFTGNVSVRLG
ncbi:MDR family NADP-dependent oxidoreductase [Sciscionella marina]|uniref:MDR family NADP-dependent oxidoreductase n=1 Tax=Sciscionella marina TaxID=508770 RepID=UPI00035C7F89|nr:NADP-dependent oxidoreductase [Sciscionella marina]